ncbi:2OG-Fe(II) oxygenase [Streptosporangium sandarakinum]|uniref:2OG-Fe(II) oxygenase n=1 Tax=Streptosporangium sandarakinum TaxID=1260955 RepID=UPI00371CB334
MTALPHFDIIGEAGPALRDRFPFIEQFGVNLYLEAPESGGELQIWDLTLDRVRSRNIASTSGTYGFDPERLPPPDVTIKPCAGDLVIVRSTRLHAVRETTEGRRVSISGFMGRGQDQDVLRLWS